MTTQKLLPEYQTYQKAVRVAMRLTRTTGVLTIPMETSKGTWTTAPSSTVPLPTTKR